jgi:hypothetical protein
MNADWIKKLLDRMRKAWAARAKKTGVKLHNPPNSYTREQLVDMCQTLHRNGISGIEQVSLLTLDFSLIGRIGEIEDLRWKHLSWSSTFKV